MLLSLLSLKRLIEVAEILKTSQRTMQRLIRLVHLKAHRVGRGYRVRAQDLEAWFEQTRTRELA
jgi:excisionase family DNA binding protein